VVARHERHPGTNWLVPAGLLTLSLLPVTAGAFRVVQLGGGAEITPENARFFAAPLPVVLHILSAMIFCILGAFQFSASLPRRKPNWHRVAGRILVPCGLAVAFSGLWMTQFYPHLDAAGPVLLPPNFDDPFLYAIRLVVGSAMALFLCLGFSAIRRRDIPRHRAWMMRSYALGIGAGTQVLTHLPWFLFPCIQGELARTLCMGAGWAINLAVVEWLISRERHRQLA
jgi:uncharacterized membrane protein